MAQCIGIYWVTLFTLSGSGCFSIEPNQNNQATIHQGSSTWIPYFGLATNRVRGFLWCSGSVCSRLLSLFLVFFYQAEGMTGRLSRVECPEKLVGQLGKDHRKPPWPWWILMNRCLVILFEFNGKTPWPWQSKYSVNANKLRHTIIEILIAGKASKN